MNDIQQRIQQQLDVQKNSDGLLRIQLSENLNEFPPELYALTNSLEILDLGGNNLSTLPGDLPRFKKLKILFASNNPFTELPEVLGQCQNLEMIGFKSCQIKRVSENALPPKLRWLILTDNQIAQLPDCFDKTPRLQKLALASNQLVALPTTLASCERLELIRISANRLTEFPDVLVKMPSLAWCAYAGNPFCRTEPTAQDELLLSELEAFELKELLGQGASGHIYLAEELETGAHKAVKIFKGDVTSDGYPEDEMRACISAGTHPNLVNVEAKIHGEKLGLVMELIPSHYQNLGLPPSLQSCTRDQFAEGFSLTQTTLLKLLQQATSALHHLHQQGLVHGDFYAHNVLIDKGGHLLLGDFGAASHMNSLTAEQIQAMLRIEKRALAHFIEDLWKQTDVDNACAEQLQTWHQQLLNDEIELADLLQKMG
ncbi:serine/threonine-protein kinase [Thiomicrorhabdus sp. 6S2-11]|uniref:Serine/threonine-protein kinase n=1 Tax=Thiomicrorhabdus marina TaxID=2818442 RepID=A0ABS3Q3S3_9GAMM|nr:leucine-rich repeat-containing protein kinase family protein [Thiomicrorhabdus marina]MBO1926485.1 serine/threonine-protein kinase [Thiomicrorhabdus marina]